jgi:hypothetical protein
MLNQIPVTNSDATYLVLGTMVQGPKATGRRFLQDQRGGVQHGEE